MALDPTGIAPQGAGTGRAYILQGPRYDPFADAAQQQAIQAQKATQQAAQKAAQQKEISSMETPDVEFWERDMEEIASMKDKFIESRAYYEHLLDKGQISPIEARRALQGEISNIQNFGERSAQQQKLFDGFMQSYRANPEMFVPGTLESVYDWASSGSKRGAFPDLEGAFDESAYAKEALANFLISDETETTYTGDEYYGKIGAEEIGLTRAENYSASMYKANPFFQDKINKELKNVAREDPGYMDKLRNRLIDVNARRKKMNLYPLTATDLYVYDTRGQYQENLKTTKTISAVPGSGAGYKQEKAVAEWFNTYISDVINDRGGRETGYAEGTYITRFDAGMDLPISKEKRSIVGDDGVTRTTDVVIEKLGGIERRINPQTREPEFRIISVFENGQEKAGQWLRGDQLSGTLAPILSEANQEFKLGEIARDQERKTGDPLGTKAGQYPGSGNTTTPATPPPLPAPRSMGPPQTKKKTEPTPISPTGGAQKPAQSNSLIADDWNKPEYHEGGLTPDEGETEITVKPDEAILSTDHIEKLGRYSGEKNKKRWYERGIEFLIKTVGFNPTPRKGEVEDDENEKFHTGGVVYGQGPEKKAKPSPQQVARPMTEGPVQEEVVVQQPIVTAPQTTVPERPFSDVFNNLIDQSYVNVIPGKQVTLGLTSDNWAFNPKIDMSNPASLKKKYPGYDDVIDELSSLKSGSDMAYLPFAKNPKKMERLKRFLALTSADDPNSISVFDSETSSRPVKDLKEFESILYKDIASGK